MAGKRTPAKMTAAEAARYMRITPSGLRAAITRGQIKGKKVNGRWVVPRSELDAWKRQIREWAKPPRKKTQRELDEEFLQRLWDSDPD